MARFDAITFDFWNTLMHEPGGTLNARRRSRLVEALAELELDVPPEVVETELAAVGRLHQEAWGRGEIFQPAEGARTLAAALGPELRQPDVDALHDAFLEASRGASLKVAEGVPEVLAELAGRGVRLSIVCDVGLTPSALLREFLEDEGLLGRFDGWAFSDEVGAYKPSPRIFEQALGQLGAEPGASAHVGDLRRTDIAGARAFGMSTVRYRGVNDDTSEGEEADHVIDRHAELLELLDA